VLVPLRGTALHIKANIFISITASTGREGYTIVLVRCSPVPIYYYLEMCLITAKVITCSSCSASSQ
jgi:hypothetical protein